MTSQTTVICRGIEEASLCSVLRQIARNDGRTKLEASIVNLGLAFGRGRHRIISRAYRLYKVIREARNVK